MGYGLGTYDDVLYYDGTPVSNTQNSERDTKINLEVFPAPRIVQHYARPFRNMWFGTNGGAYRYDGRT
jgi:hypothetical protein